MEQIQQLAKIAAALSDPIRLQILELLAKGRDDSYLSTPHLQYPHALCPYIDLRYKLEDIPTSRLSYHLKELRDAELLVEHRSGKQVFYEINQQKLAEYIEMVRISYLSADPQ